jgi:hypothetical protein
MTGSRERGKGTEDRGGEVGRRRKARNENMVKSRSFENKGSRCSIVIITVNWASRKGLQ